MTKYSICHNNHILVVTDENKNKDLIQACPNCGGYAEVLARYEVQHKLTSASYRYATKGTTLALRRMKHWNKALTAIEKMEKDHD